MLRGLVIFGGLAAANFLAGVLGLAWTAGPADAGPACPMAGVAYLGLMWFGWRAWPSVAVGVFAANVALGVAPELAFPLALGEAAAAVAAVALAHRWLREPLAASSSRDLLRLLGVIAFGSAVGATLATLTLVLEHTPGLPAQAVLWKAHWLGGASAMLVLVPLGLWLRERESWRLGPVWDRRRLLAAGFALVAILVGLWLAYVTLRFVYVVPPLVAAALLGHRIGAGLAGLVAGVGILVIVTIVPDATQGIVAVGQIFLLITLATTFLLAAVLDERDMTEALRAAVDESAATAARWREAEERLRVVLAGARVGTWQVDLNPTAYRWDDGFRDLYGFDPDEVPAAAVWSARIHPDDRERLEANVHHAIAGGPAAWVQDFRILHPTRGQLWIHDRVQLTRDGEGRPILLSGLNFDVTERRQAEEEVRRAEEELRLAHEASGQGAWHWEEDGTAIWSPKALSMIGLEPGDQISEGAFWSRVHLEDRARVRSAIDYAVSPIGKGAYCAEFRVVLPDGRVRWIHDAGRLKPGEDASWSGHGVMRDITEEIEGRRALESARSAAEYAARHDSLTGLPARGHFRDRLEELLAAAGPTGRSALLFIDLDEFKSVNDSLGHPAGDQLLVEAARRLRTCMGRADLLGRLGGDEFVVVRTCSEGTLATEGMEALAQGIIRRLSEPFQVDGHQVVVGASIGIAVAEGHGLCADELLKKADIALYRAKAAGRGVFRFFEPELERAAQDRQRLRNDLYDAEGRGEFVLHYQPVVDLATGMPKAFEALLRWNHPTRGLLGPAEFVGLAETSGAMDGIGAWVLAEACREAAAWPGDLIVSVNLSPRQFRGGGLAKLVERTLRDAGLSPARLQVEITESVLLQDDEEVRSTLDALRGLGVRLSIDDFGTGYSSLGYLRRFAVDNIKIDRSFVADIAENPRSMAILRTLMRLGDELGLSLTPEGVETAEQLAQLRDIGCREGQGFLFGRPAPASAAAPVWAWSPALPVALADGTTQDLTRPQAQHR